MALWKENAPAPVPNVAPVATVAPNIPVREPERVSVAPVPIETRAKQRTDAKESVIASDVSIEGKIDGSGHVRIAGKFKGDVRVDGNLTIDAGAQLTGQVVASVVIVGGELHGNIANAKRVELLETGVIAGDVKAGSLTVAAGSRMRGQVEFGWDESKGSGKVS
jgi:cytoskeletal protein CcmA (bactofilin family)